MELVEVGVAAATSRTKGSGADAGKTGLAKTPVGTAAEKAVRAPAGLCAVTEMRSMGPASAGPSV